MISILRCGFDSRHMVPFSKYHNQGLPHYLLLLIKSSCYFYLNGKKQEIPANTAILFNRNRKIYYGCSQPYYNDDWIHFDISPEDTILSQLSIPFDTPLYLPNISLLTSYIRLMVQENSLASLHQQKSLDLLMRSLLYSLDSQLHHITTGENRKYFFIFNDLRTSIQNAPYQTWNLDELAASLHMSTSYFQHLYKDFFGISCRHDIIQARIELAKFYLSTTNMPVRAVAAMTGYENELHFMRQFKKFTGMTPTQHRNLLS